jgi:hypothetical protein
VGKSSLPLKRYLYISQHKIGMYDSQQPYNWWRQLAKRLLRISHFKYKDIELDLPALDDLNLYQKMQQIIARIKREQTIGTVDQPAAYIHDTLPLFQVLMPSRPGTYDRFADDPGFIYFGGGTDQTSLGLVGSPHHLVGFTPDEKPRLHSSDVPRLVEFLNKRMNELVPGRPPRYDGLGAIWHADIHNTEPRIPLEFFAYRVHDSLKPLGRPTKEKRVLLYTPLYVAYKD